MSDHFPKEVQDRIAKIEALREQGINPFKDRYETSNKISDLKSQDDSKLPPATDVIENTKIDYSVAGRIMTFRSHGKLSFAQLQDQSGRIQICFMKDVLGDKDYKFTQKMLDMGDFIGVKGELFVTNHGEATLMVKEFELLTKTIRPLPEKWHGIADQEIKYRKRYLDMLSDPKSFERMMFRSRFMQLIREFLNSHNFIEIETPILSASASGALAKPFSTHHNALDHDFYLRIAPETWLKKAVTGGMERVFEFAKCFRNEGMDPSHLQEFTMLEYYASYWNYEDNMKFTEQLMEFAVKELFGTTKITHQGTEIDFKAPYPRVSFRDLLIKDCGIDINKHDTAASLLEAIKAKGIHLDGAESLGRGNLIDTLYKKVSRPGLIEPMFLIHHPKDLSPLARGNDDDEAITDRFQLVVNTWEVINAYSELVDPIDQKERFLQQSEAKAGGDEEAMMYDHSFVEAMEHGMPPMSGWGMGIDRIMSLLTDQENIKDTVLFPLMRPSQEELAAVNLGKTEAEKESSSSVKPQTMTDKKAKIKAGFTREQAIQQIEKYVDPKLQSHLYFCEQAMKGLADHYGFGEERDLWGLAGLVHDIDWTITEADLENNKLAHCGEKLDMILGEINATPEFIEVVRSHYKEHGIELDTVFKKALFAVDELTGLITAVTLVRPSKKMADVKVKSVKKKMKDKGFAAAVDRDLIRTCETNLNTPLDEFIALTLEAMKEIAEEQGL